MRMKILLVGLILASSVCSAEDDVIVVTGSAAAPSSTILPSKGMDKSAVTRSYGQPSQKRAAVGGGSLQQPPITRWDYEGFSVIFENDHVVDSVERGHPASVKVREGLALGTP